MTVRIDKFLWAVRVFKSRSDAADAVRQNRVTVDGSYCKPSREVKIGDKISVRRQLLTYTFRVIELVSNRQGAKLVERYVENITPQSELDKLNAPREMVFVQRDRGAGRPTKRDRRVIDQLMGDIVLPEADESNDLFDDDDDSN